MKKLNHLAMQQQESGLSKHKPKQRHEFSFCPSGFVAGCSLNRSCLELLTSTFGSLNKESRLSLSRSKEELSP